MKRPKITKMEESSCKIRVAIDLSLDKLMTEKVGFLRHREQAAEVCIVVLFVSQERGKSLKQLQRCYSLNRRACNPVRVGDIVLRLVHEGGPCILACHRRL